MSLHPALLEMLDTCASPYTIIHRAGGKCHYRLHMVALRDHCSPSWLTASPSCRRWRISSTREACEENTTRYCSIVPPHNTIVRHKKSVASTWSVYIGFRPHDRPMSRR